MESHFLIAFKAACRTRTEYGPEKTRIKKEPNSGLSSSVEDCHNGNFEKASIPSLLFADNVNASRRGLNKCDGECDKNECSSTVRLGTCSRASMSGLRALPGVPVSMSISSITAGSISGLLMITCRLASNIATLDPDWLTASSKSDENSSVSLSL